MTAQRVILLTGREVAGLLSLDECISAVEQAFRLHGEGKAATPGVLGIHVQDGGFHIKAGVMELSRTYFATKVNANFSENPVRFGLPTIQGVIVIFDAASGCPLAVMDSIEITLQRTAAATAVAARHLARRDSHVVTICGCGNQGRAQLRALARVLPIERAYAFDIDGSMAERLAEELAEELHIQVEAISDLSDAVRQSDVCVTCTTSRRPFLHRQDVPRGMFIAAVGADSPEKQELDPNILAESKVVVDVLEQCATIGELHHALDLGVVARDGVHAELGELVAGKRPGRATQDEITVFDSTGMALQDVAAAALVYEKAVLTGRGIRLKLSV